MHLLLLLPVLALAQATVHNNVVSMQPKVFPPALLNRFIHQHNSRIVNGNEVDPPNSFNYQVGLFFVLDDGRRAFCGGSLISENYVLTAAHCTNGIPKVEVVLGAHRVNEDEPTQLRITSTDLYTHELYGSVPIIYDIALIKLPEPVKLSEFIGLVKLPSLSHMDKSFEGVNVTLTGWGKTSDAATGISDYLQYSQTSVMSNRICTLYYVGLVGDTHICSDSYGSGQVACNGDSGGPLVSDDGIQVGVVSFGLGLGCDHLWPSVYTRVTSYLDWIQEHSDVVISNGEESQFS